MVLLRTKQLFLPIMNLVGYKNKFFCNCTIIFFACLETICIRRVSPVPCFFVYLCCFCMFMFLLFVTKCMVCWEGSSRNSFLKETLCKRFFRLLCAQEKCAQNLLKTFSQSIQCLLRKHNFLNIHVFLIP